MSNWLYRGAALLCLIALLAHELIGAPMVLPPLSQANLADEIAWLHTFSWHVGSVSVAAMAAMYVYASARPGNLALAVVATLMSAGFACLGIGLAVFGNEVLWDTPAPWFWSVIAVTGGLGIWTALGGETV